MASCWRSSGVNRAGLELDFDGGIWGQDTTCRRCAKWDDCGARFARPPAYSAGSATVHLGISNGLLVAGVRVDFKNTESVALGVDEVALPARLRDCEFR